MEFVEAGRRCSDPEIGVDRFWRGMRIQELVLDVMALDKIRLPDGQEQARRTAGALHPPHPRQGQQDALHHRQRRRHDQVRPGEQPGHHRALGHQGVHGGAAGRGGHEHGQPVRGGLLLGLPRRRKGRGHHQGQRRPAVRVGVAGGGAPSR